MSLTQDRAEHRSKVIKINSIRYNFFLHLREGQGYSGLAFFEFQLSHVPEHLHIDFNGTTIKGLVVNNQTIQDLGQNEKGFITLEGKTLKSELNEVWVHYENDYDNDGSGCVSYVDEIDKRQYLYTHFEPYAANKVFPCFDQPNLKAQMTLTVIAPKLWTILSNELSQKTESYDKNNLALPSSLFSSFTEGIDQNVYKMTEFPTTKTLSTYLYAFTAGEYFQVPLQEEKRIKNIPMSNFCMQSSRPYLQKLAPFIFELTLEAVNFYEKFFDYPYPFPVYHQVWVHEFKFRAMENAGLVIFDDFFLYKEEVSASKMYDLADTVTHEISHHWFGNLVTMEWWDDLWLNESFAFFISHLCNEAIKDNLKTYKFQSITAGFVDMKGWGYEEDKRSLTTHPIRAQVQSTGVALANFDGITYTKGASAIKQLMSLIGLQNFSKALSTYFHKYQWKNATINYFLAQIAVYLTKQEFSLQKWKKMWLQTPSLNVLQPIWSCEDHSEISKLTITQRLYSKDHQTLRYHKIKIAFFDQDANIIEVKQVLVLPQLATEVPYDGSRHIKAILLNYEDQTFMENIIDRVSLSFFSKNLNRIKDILTRTIIWSCLYSMVNEAKLTVNDFATLVLSLIFEEPSLILLDKQFNNLLNSINSCLKIGNKNQVSSRIFERILKELQEKQGIIPEKILILKDKLISFARTEEQIKFLLLWKEGKELQQYQLSSGQKWSIVLKAYSLPSLSIVQKQAIFAQQKSEDDSITAIDNRYICEALIANQQQFQAIYEKIKSKDVSVAIKKLYGLGWRHECHLEKLVQYKKRFFEDVVKLSEVLQGDHLSILISCFNPIDDDIASQLEGFKYLEHVVNKQHLIEVCIAVRKMINDLQKRHRNTEFNSS